MSLTTVEPHESFSLNHSLLTAEEALSVLTNCPRHCLVRFLTPEFIEKSDNKALLAERIVRDYNDYLEAGEYYDSDRTLRSEIRLFSKIFDFLPEESSASLQKDYFEKRGAIFTPRNSLDDESVLLFLNFAEKRGYTDEAVAALSKFRTKRMEFLGSTIEKECLEVLTRLGVPREEINAGIKQHGYEHRVSLLKSGLATPDESEFSDVILHERKEEFEAFKELPAFAEWYVDLISKAQREFHKTYYRKNTNLDFGEAIFMNYNPELYPLEGRGWIVRTAPAFKDKLSNLVDSPLAQAVIFDACNYSRFKPEDLSAFVSGFLIGRKDEALINLFSAMLVTNAEGHYIGTDFIEEFSHKTDIRGICQKISENVNDRYAQQVKFACDRGEGQKALYLYDCRKQSLTSLKKIAFTR